MSFSRRSLLLGSAALPVLASLPAGAATTPVQNIRKLAQAQMASAQIPAMFVTAISNGRTILADGFGVASPAFNVAANDRTLFHLGSVGKHFTAALVLRLAEAGTIALDRPIGTYVRDVPMQFADRSVYSLLTHTSGIPDYESLPGFEEDRFCDRATFLQRISAMQPAFGEGEAWDYSNTAFVLLGYLIADAKGRTYRAQVDEDLLKPLHVQEARVDDASSVIPGRAEPFTIADGKLKRATQLDGDFSGWADGGVIMSARDAVRWDEGLRTKRSVTAFGDAQMRTSAMLKTGRPAAYGAAFFLDRWHGVPIAYHTGAMPGFLAIYARTARSAVMVAINLATDASGAALRRVALETLEAIEPNSTPLSLRAIKDEAPAQTDAFNKMLHRGAAKLDVADFAPELSVLLQRDAGRQVFANRAGLGAPAAFELVESFGEEGGGTVRRYRARYGSGRIDHYAVAYASDGKIYRVRGI